MGYHVIYLNEKDTCEFIQEEVALDSVFFQPTVFNPTLHFEICNKEDLSVVEQQDMYYLRDFRWKTLNKDKIFAMSDNSFAIVHKKLQEIQKLLSEQYTMYWPCMSRTLTLEILFYMAQITSEKNSFLYLNENSTSLTTQVIEYFQTSYSEKIAINSICTLFGTNRTKYNHID